MLNLGHTGDWHICNSQYGKRLRAEAIARSAKNLCKKAHDLKLDALTNAGDILDSSSVRSYPLQQLDEIHEMLVGMKIPMYTLTGNHDMDTPTWISRYHNKDGYGIVCVDNTFVETKDGNRIVGFMTKTPKELFRMLEEGEWRDTDIAMWHGGVAEFVGGAFGGKYPTAEEILNASPIKNWLLADIHVCEFITPPSGGIIGYPGPVEMTDINENPYKFLCTMQFDRGVYVPDSLKRHRLNTTPVLTIPVTTEKESEAARKLLHETLGTPRMIWFHYNDEFQAVVKDLYSLTAQEDVVREKNVTVRKVNEIVDTGESVQVDISGITSEETDGLPEAFKQIALQMVNKAGTPQVLIEKLINQHEDSFV